MRTATAISRASMLLWALGGALPMAEGLTSISTAQFSSEERQQAIAAQIAAALAQQRADAPAPVRRHGSSVGTHAGEARENNCAGGKLFPEFYVLGAKNTATSSLWADLRDRGVWAAPGTFDVKEWLAFQKYSNLPQLIQQAIWMESMPECPEEPRVMADFSVTNLFDVQLPSDLAWSMELGYPSRSEMDYKNWDTARLIRKFHDEAGAREPKFVIMLREPLERVQSEYYHTLPLKNCRGCMVNNSFVDSFATNVALLQQKPPQVSDWFWKSFYSRQIEEFLRYFDPKQFLFVPDKEYFAIKPAAFSASLLSWLNLDAQPWTEASHENEHTSRPPLDVELPPGTPTREAYEAFMAPENARLLSTLVKAHAFGATLAGYPGALGDATGVAAWLQRGW